MNLLFLLQKKFNWTLLKWCASNTSLSTQIISRKSFHSPNNYVVETRIAEKADYEEVMEINRHWYFGNDLLVNYYHKYMDDKNKFGYMVKVNGKNAGFFLYEIIDDAERCCLQFGRIKEEYKGKGILLNIYRSLPDISGKYPKCKTLIATTVEHIAANNYTKHFQTGRIVFKRNVAYGEMGNNSINHHMLELKKMSANAEKCIFDGTKLISRERIVNMLQNPKLVSENRWVIKWLPYAQMQANNDAILNLEPMVFATCVGESQEIIAASFGCASWVPRGYLYTTDFYPSKSENYDDQLQLLNCHLIKHLNNILIIVPKKPTGLKIIFEILYPSSLENLYVRDMLHKCLKMAKPNQDFDCYVVEDRVK